MPDPCASVPGHRGDKRWWYGTLLSPGQWQHGRVHGLLREHGRVLGSCEERRRVADTLAVPSFLAHRLLQTGLWTL